MFRSIVAWWAVARRNQVSLALLALLVGVLAGYSAVAFRYLIQIVQFGAFGFMGESVASRAAELPWYYILLVPTIGGFFIGLFIKYVMPGHRSVGVPDVIQAAALNTGRISLKEGIAGAVLNAASLGVGGSAGREGPMVHLASTLAQFVSERFRLGPPFTITLLGCAVAAGVSASFNAPIAGVFFAIEVVLRSYALRTLVPVFIASVAGATICRIHFGDFPAFTLPHYDLVSQWEFPAFALLGAVCAVVAIVFMWSLVFTEDVADRIPIPDWLRPAVGGLMVGAIALFVPQVLGVGYETTDATLKDSFTLPILLLLIVCKTAATSITLASRFGGGVFSPSLFLGALTGAVYGTVALWVFPDLSSSHGVYALVGMGAVAGAVLGAPASTILIVAELTGDTEMTIAMMIAVSVASLMTNEILGRNFFQWQLRRRGVLIRGGREQRILRSTRIKSVMRRRYQLMDGAMHVADLGVLFDKGSHDTVFVTKLDGSLLGAVFAEEWRAREPTEEDSKIPIADIARQNIVVLSEDDNLEQAVLHTEQTNQVVMPVVNNLLESKVTGSLSQRDLLRAYNRVLRQARSEESGETE